MEMRKMMEDKGRCWRGNGSEVEEVELEVEVVEMKTKDDAREVMDPRWRDTINPSSWHLRSIISSEMVA